MRNEKTKLEKLDLEQHLYGCSISYEPVIDPVIVSDHQTYERVCIQDVMRHNNKSPLTREILTPVMYNNIAVRQTNETITELVEKHNNLIDTFENKYNKYRMSKERIAELEKEREDVESQCKEYVEQINTLQVKTERLKGKLGEAKSLSNEYMRRLEERQALTQNDNIPSESRVNIKLERRDAVRSTEEAIRLLDKEPGLRRRGVLRNTVKVTRSAAAGATAAAVAGGVACGVAEAAIGTPVLATAGASLIGVLGAETALAGVVATIGTGGVALIVFAGIGLCAGIAYGLYQVFKSDEAVDDASETSRGIN